jgi:2-oxoglutarate ferredoxin oxidoreductase subunit delta
MSKYKPPKSDRQIMAGQIGKSVLASSSRPLEGKIIIFDSWCKRCGICTHFCPTGALETDENGLPFLAHPEKCTLCGMCWMRCPDMAIVPGPNGKDRLKDKKSKDKPETKSDDTSNKSE